MGWKWVGIGFKHGNYCVNVNCYGKNTQKCEKMGWKWVELGWKWIFDMIFMHVYWTPIPPYDP